MFKDSLADMNRNSFLMIGGLLFLLVVAALSLYVIKPSFLEWRQAANSYKVLSAAITSNIDLSSDIERLQNERDSMERRLAGDSATLPYKQVESHVIGKLQGLAWSNNLKLGGVQPSDGIGVAEFGEMLFNISLSGDFFDIYAMLGGLEKELGFVVVKRLQLQPGNIQDEKMPLKMSMTIASYRVED